jgi:DNA-binding MarR family transcriptional regulator
MARVAHAGADRRLSFGTGPPGDARISLKPKILSVEKYRRGEVAVRERGSNVPRVEIHSLTTSDQIDDVVDFWQRENPDVDVTTKSLSLRLRSAAHQLDRVMRQEMTALDMEVWELEMLLSLRRAPEGQRSAGALCRLAQVTSGAITNRLVRLEERGWVRRDVDPSDRRQVVVSLTAAGHDRADTLLAAKSDAEQRFFAGLSRKTVERLTADLRDLLVSLDEQSHVASGAVATDS